MATLTEITQKVKKRNNQLDGISDALVLDLEEYQREYEIYLRRKRFDLDTKGNLRRTGKNFSTISVMNPFQKLGYNKLSISYIGQYNGVVTDQILFNKRLGLKFGLDFKDVTILKHLKNVDLGDMLLRGHQLDAVIKRELVNAIALEAPYQSTVDNLATSLLGAGEKMGNVVRYADTTMRTSLYGLTRTVDKQVYDSIGEDEYIYVGALDRRTRPFCASRIGKEFTTEQINKFGSQNGSGLDGFFSPGGYNCRHSLIGTSAFQ
jgi:hypothetical protein